MKTYAHDWIEILNRRWCLTCGLFQSRKVAAAPWFPTGREVCPMDTPRAAAQLKKDANEQV